MAMFKNVSKRERALAAATVAAALGAAIYSFIIEPLSGRWNDLDKEIRDKEALLRKGNRILRSKEFIKEQHAEYTAYFQSAKLTPEEESAGAYRNK